MEPDKFVAKYQTKQDGYRVEIAFSVNGKYHYTVETHPSQGDAVWRQFVYRSQYICMLLERLIYESRNYTWHTEELQDIAIELFRNVECCHTVPDQIINQQRHIYDLLTMPGEKTKQHIDNRWNQILKECRIQLQKAEKCRSQYGWN